MNKDKIPIKTVKDESGEIPECPYCMDLLARDENGDIFCECGYVCIKKKVKENE